MSISELLGVGLFGYGIWFTAEGVKRCLGDNKDWWRPLEKRKRHYPYPASGVLLGVCFMVMGLTFALQNVWEHSRKLAYAGGAIFVLVLVVGVAQPRFLHPRWYARLHDRLGNKGVMRLRRAALQMDDEDWREIVASEEEFEAWVARAVPRRPREPRRGYKKRR